MRNLENAINVADQRIRMRRLGNSNAQITLAIGFCVPRKFSILFVHDLQFLCPFRCDAELQSVFWCLHELRNDLDVETAFHY